MSTSPAASAALPIVFAADGNFSVPLAIAVESLLRSAHPSTRYAIHVLDDGVLGFAKWHIESLRGKYHFSICYHPVADMVQGVSTTHYFPRVSFARFMIPELLSGDCCNRIIYCDADVLVCRDLSSLYKMDMGDCPIGAITEMGIKAMDNNRHMQAWKKTFAPSISPARCNYCNSGVLLFNWKSWQEGKYANRILEAARGGKGALAKFPDQDLLNAECAGRIYPVPPAYNSVPLYAECYMGNGHYFQNALDNSPYSPDELREALENPYLIHFAGQKPRVLEGARYPLEQPFIDFWAKSAWRDYMPYAPRIGSMSPSRFIKQNVPISTQLGTLRQKLFKYTLAAALPFHPKRKHYAEQRDGIRRVLENAYRTAHNTHATR